MTTYQAVAAHRRDLTMEDEDQIQEVECKTFGRASLPWFVDDHKHKPTFVMLAREGEQIVGCCAMTYGPRGQDSKLAELWCMSVDPEFQRRGIAAGIMDRLIRLARDKRRNTEVIVLFVKVENERAIALYRGFGFEIVSTSHFGDTHTMSLRLRDIAVPEVKV